MKTTETVDAKSIKRQEFRNACVDYLTEMPESLRCLALNSKYPKNNIDLFTLIQFLLNDCKYIFNCLKTAETQGYLDITDSNNERASRLYNELNIAYDDILNISEYVSLLIGNKRVLDEKCAKSILDPIKNLFVNYEDEKARATLKHCIRNDSEIHDAEIKAWYTPQLKMYEQAYRNLEEVLENEFNSDDKHGEYTVITKEAPQYIVRLQTMTGAIMVQTEFLYSCR